MKSVKILFSLIFLVVLAFFGNNVCSAPKFPDGALIKGSTPQVYVIEDGRKRPIPDPATFLQMGFRWEDIREVPDDILKQIPDGEPLPSLRSQGFPPQISRQKVTRAEEQKRIKPKGKKDVREIITSTVDPCQKFYGGYCVDWVRKRTGMYPPRLPSVEKAIDLWTNHGNFPTGSVPRKGAIAVFDIFRPWGHVGVVEEVKGDQFLVSEMNFGPQPDPEDPEYELKQKCAVTKNWNKITKRWVKPGDKTLLGFIYVKPVGIAPKIQVEKQEKPTVKAERREQEKEIQRLKAHEEELRRWKKLINETQFEDKFAKPGPIITHWRWLTDKATGQRLDEKYRELYRAANDYLRKAKMAVIDAERYFKQGKLNESQNRLNGAEKSYKIAINQYRAAIEVYDGLNAAGQELARGLQRSADTALIGLASLVPGAPALVDRFLLARDFVADSVMYGLDQASREAVVKIGVSTVFRQFVPGGRPVKGLGDIDLSKLTEDLRQNSSFRIRVETQMLNALSQSIAEDRARQITRRFVDEFSQFLSPLAIEQKKKIVAKREEERRIREAQRREQERLRTEAERRRREEQRRRLEAKRREPEQEKRKLLSTPRMQPGDVCIVQNSMAGALNLRDQPSLKGRILGVFPNGTEVIFLQRQGFKDGFSWFAVRVPSTGQVGFMVSKHLKKRIASQQNSAPSPVQWREGSLLRQQGRPEVYVIKGSRKYHIPDPQTFNILGYNWNQVKDIEGGVLGRILPGSPPLPSLGEGTLIKASSRPEVFVIQGGRKCWIPNPATFKAKGYDWNRIRLIPDWALERIPRGPDVRR